MNGFSFYVLGNPAPQGSKEVRGHTKDGRAILDESCKTLKPWREMVGEKP